MKTEIILFYQIVKNDERVGFLYSQSPYYEYKIEASIEEIVDFVLKKNHYYVYVKIGDFPRVKVLYASGEERDFLYTEHDGIEGNNLENLPIYE